MPYYHSTWTIMLDSEPMTLAGIERRTSRFHAVPFNPPYVGLSSSVAWTLEQWAHSRRLPVEVVRDGPA